MIDRGKRRILGVDISVIDYESAVSVIRDAAHDTRALSVTALAVHGVMTGALDPAHRYRLNRLDMVTPDGQPVRWALSWLHGEHLPDRVYGPNLTLKVCEAAAAEGLPIFLYGSTESVLAALREKLQSQFPDLVIAGTRPSRFRKLTDEEQQELAEEIRLSGARITLVGLGCPRQEVFAYEMTPSLGMPVLAVGAAFDFHAGLLQQAPRWMQDAGLEWLFRLTREPGRLWRRYLLLNPAFCGLLLMQRLGLRSPADRQEVTPEPIRYG